jgi:putative intracellular protease/amidase
MKRLILILLLFSLFAGFKKDNPKVLLYIQDNSMDLGFMLTHEVGKIKELLKKSGYKVIIATISGKVLKADSITVRPDLKLNTVNTDQYVGFILPCMAPADTIVTSAEIGFVKKVLASDKPIAAQTSAVLILAKSGA